MSLVPFLSEVIKIKRTVRTGWKRKNVPEPESVSDHMYFMALMALVATPEHLNKDKCIKIAIVHDLAECITGDITPHDGISPDDKHKMEKEAIEKIVNLLPSEAQRDEVMSLYLEYENKSTPEACFVKDLDKLEMIHQAFHYERETEINLGGFFKSVEQKIQSREAKQIENDIRDQYSNLQSDKK